MIYFYIGLASLAVFVMNVVSFYWLLVSQNNQFHKIINLWLDDPIEKILLVELSEVCPDRTQEEKIKYKFRGTSGLCQCDSKSEQNMQSNITYTECSNLKCENSNKIKKINAIPSSFLFYLYSSTGTNITYKLCTSRIEGYSFAKKAPIEQGCQVNEQYCSWNSKDSQEFDVDYGYCIPKNRECYQQAVQLKEVSNNQQQLPLVGFSLDNQASQLYNINDYQKLMTEQLLEINKVSVPSEYSGFLQQDNYFHTNFMPRVKNECRQQLKDSLNIYIGPEVALQIYTALVFFSFLSLISSFFITGFKDFEDFQDCNWQTKMMNYLQKKKYNRKHPLYRKLYYIQKLIVNIIQIALYAVIINQYVSMINVMGDMINSQCVDSQISQIINYGDLNGGIFNYNLTAASLGLTIFFLITDINLYVFLKKILRYFNRILRKAFFFVYLLFTSRDFSQLKQLEYPPDPDIVDQYQINNQSRDVESEKNQIKQENSQNKSPSFQDMSVVKNLKVDESKQQNKMTDEIEPVKSAQKITSRSDNLQVISMNNKRDQSISIENKSVNQQVEEKEDLNSNIRCLESSKISEQIPKQPIDHKKKISMIFQKRRNKIKQKNSSIFENLSKQCVQTAEITQQANIDDYSMQNKENQVVINNFEIQSPSTNTSSKYKNADTIQLDFQIEIQNL